MADAITPPEVIEPGKVDTQPEVKVNPNVPLSRQIDKMIQATPERIENKDESPKDPEKKEEPAKTDNSAGDKVIPEEKTVSEGDKKPAEFDPEDEPELEQPVDLPPVAKYILENLPNIQVTGHQGEDGKDKVFSVKRIEDLPDDFEFASKRAEIAFNAAIASQEMNARDLLNKYRQEENNNKLLEIQNQEALDVESDVKQLQKEGVLGKFPSTDDPEFNKNEAVKEANEIYDLFQKTNQAYAKANRTYRISYRDAADKYYVAKSRQTPPKVEEPKKPEPPVKSERDKVSEKVGAPSGTNSDKTPVRLPRGATQQDVLKLYRAGRI